MELFHKKEIKYIIDQLGITSISNLHWTVEAYSESLIGFLGEHLSLKVNFESEGIKTEKTFFVKCIPHRDELKASSLRESNFFQKEYVMLEKLFKNFKEGESMFKNLHTYYYLFLYTF